jgi:hypothetical protein
MGKSRCTRRSLPCRDAVAGRLSRVGELCFEVGDALVVEAEVVPGGLESLVEGAVAGGELADALLAGGVLGGDAGDGLLGPLGFEVADLAEEPGDAGALGEDLGVGLGTIYRNFPTQEALYQAIIIRRTKALIAEAAVLANAPDSGKAFFGYFTRVVENAMRTKAMTDLLARAGIDPKSGMAGVGDDMRHAVEVLLGRAQQAGAVRPDLHMPELMAILTAACLAA